MSGAKNTITPNPARFPLAAAPKPAAVVPSAGSWLERLRRCCAYPVVVSLLYSLGGLCWLLIVNPLLAIWFYGIPPSPLSSQLPNVLAIIASGGLLYWLLQAHEKPAYRDLEARVRERTVELLAINQTLEQEIAARIQVEFALRDSEERFRQLAEHIREVFWVYGIGEERLLYVSPAYEEVWERPIHGLYDRPLDWIEAVHPDDRPRIQAAYFAKNRLGYLDEEYRIVRPDGAIRWIWDRGFPIHDEAGYIYRIAGLAEDITARKLAEDRLRRQQVELARMSRLSLAVELASNLAHELNQPLAAIVAYTQACLALLRQPHTDPRELTGTLDEIINQGLRAGEIIRHLRELVQKHPAIQTPLDLNDLIRSVIHYAQLELRQAGVSVKLELAETLPAVLADDIQIQLVVLYLVRNAIEAMNEAKGGPRELTLRTARLGANQTLATISDTGPGLGLEVTEHLFEPFFSTKPTGMGLGLAVSRSIVESQDGRLWATPNPDRGVSFHFSLPVHVSPRSLNSPV